MFINYNKTIGLPVLAVKAGQKLCKVKDFVIDTNSGKFLGIFCIKSGFIFTSKYFIGEEKIKNFGKNALTIEDEKSLENPYQNETIAPMIKKRIKIKNNNVLTESGSDLGEVKNFEIDLISNKLSKIVVSGGIFQDFFRGEIIIPYSQIVSIGRDAIIVKDAVVKQIEGTQETQTKKELSATPICIKRGVGS
ncbi:MAG: PRC-barrel domain-containing protein [Patescibacteria group bacterium]